jgi:hypothetical protein
MNNKKKVPFEMIQKELFFCIDLKKPNIAIRFFKVLYKLFLETFQNFNCILVSWIVL